jgi:hypothetical protein
MTLNAVLSVRLFVVFFSSALTFRLPFLLFCFWSHCVWCLFGFAEEVWVALLKIGLQANKETEEQRDTDTHTQRERERERERVSERERDTETQRHRDTETQRHRDTETQRHRDTETQRGRESVDCQIDLYCRGAQAGCITNQRAQATPLSLSLYITSQRLLSSD